MAVRARFTEQLTTCSEIGSGKTAGSQQVFKSSESPLSISRRTWRTVPRLLPSRCSKVLSFNAAICRACVAEMSLPEYPAVRLRPSNRLALSTRPVKTSARRTAFIGCHLSDNGRELPRAVWHRERHRFAPAKLAPSVPPINVRRSAANSGVRRFAPEPGAASRVASLCLLSCSTRRILSTTACLRSPPQRSKPGCGLVRQESRSIRRIYDFPSRRRNAVAL